MSELEYGLRSSARTGSLVMPSSLSMFNDSVYITRLVMLYYLTRLHRPQKVVETGVWAGLSSWAILQALRDNDVGQLVSIDIGIKRVGDLTVPGNEIGSAVPKALRGNWRLLIGESNTLLPHLLKDSASIDMFYHDSDHSYENMSFEFNTVLPHLSKNGMLSSDDVEQNDAFKEVCMKLSSPAIVGNRFGYGFKKSRE